MTDQDKTRARRDETFEDAHDTTGRAIPLVGAPVIDGAEPVDEATGLHISHALTPAWRYPIGDTRYRPHRDSITAAREAGITDDELLNRRIRDNTTADGDVAAQISDQHAAADTVRAAAQPSD